MLKRQPHKNFSFYEKESSFFKFPINDTINPSINENKSDNSTVLKDIINNHSSKINEIKTQKKQETENNLTDINPDYLFDNFDKLYNVKIENFKEYGNCKIDVVKNLTKTFDSVLENKNNSQEKNKTSNDFYKNYLEKIIQNHDSKCDCLNCKVYKTVNNSRMLFENSQIDEKKHLESKTIFKTKFNKENEKSFQRPMSSKDIHLKEKEILDYNSNLCLKTEQSIPESIYENYKKEVRNEKIQIPNGEKRILFRRKTGLPPLLSKEQKSFVFLKQIPIIQENKNITNNNQIKRSISTGIPIRLI